MVSRWRSTVVPTAPSNGRPRSNDVMDELVLDGAALHPDRKKCGCGRWRALKRRAWADISATTDGPKWIFLWQCACGSDAFDHVEGSDH
jgi:hypothetical protein